MDLTPNTDIENLKAQATRDRTHSESLHNEAKHTSEVGEYLKRLAHTRGEVADLKTQIASHKAYTNKLLQQIALLQYALQTIGGLSLKAQGLLGLYEGRSVTPRVVGYRPDHIDPTAQEDVAKELKK